MVGEQNNSSANHEEVQDEMEEQVNFDHEKIVEEDDVIDNNTASEKANENEVNEEIKALEAKLSDVDNEKNDLYDRLLRVQAEYDNFKRRTQKERAADLKYKAEDLVNELLPVLDNFERALQVEVTDETKSLIDGITMVYNQLVNALESQGVTGVETKGETFDPNKHHAVMQVEDEAFESNEIVEELQKGYMLKDKVIRAAMVKVNK